VVSDLRYDDEPLPVYGSRYEPQGWGHSYSGLRCGCAGPQSCPKCDGSDDWSVELEFRNAFRDAEKARAWSMRSDRSFRGAWLLTFHDPAIRREQADWADLRYGPMPGLLHDIDEKASA